MKNEKFCFSKGIGLIALVGVLLVGFVLLTQMTNQSTSTSTRAAGECSYSHSGVKYSIADGQCLKEVITSWSTSFQCNKGVVSKQEICNPVAAATGCTYRYSGATFSVPVDTCLTDAAPVDVNGTAVNPPSNTSWKCVSVGNMQKSNDCNPSPAVAATGCTYRYRGETFAVPVDTCLTAAADVNGVASPKNTSWRCVSIGNMQKSNDCNPSPAVAATGCTYRYMGKTFAVPVDTCLTDAADVNGVASPKNTSWKCVSIGNMQKLSSCNPVAAATGCTYNYSGQTFSLALNVCLKSAPAVNGVNPPLNSNKCIPSTATSTTGYVAKHTDCAPTCDEIGNAGFKCGGTVAYLARNAANTGTCKCQDTAAKSVNPAIWGP